MTKETTVENILSQIQVEYSKGINSDSSQLSHRYIYSKALGIRARLISQKSKNKQSISDSSYSIFPCLQIVKVKPSDCPFVPPTGCLVARSKFPLPKIISDYNSELIKRVGTIEPIEGEYIEYSKIEKKNLKYQKGSKFAANLHKYYIHDNYLYLVSKKIPAYVELIAVAYDPFEAEKFNIITCDIQDCITPYEIDFKIDWELVSALTLMVAENILTLFDNNQRNDRNEDNVDESQRPYDQENQT